MPNFLPLVPEEGRKADTPLAFHQSEGETTPPSLFLTLLPVESTESRSPTSTSEKQCKDTQAKSDSVLQKSEEREKRDKEALKGCSMLVPIQKDKEVNTGEAQEEKVDSEESIDVDCKKTNRGQTDSQRYREKQCQEEQAKEQVEEKQIQRQAKEKETKEKQAVDKQTRTSHPTRAPYSQHPYDLQRRILNATTQSRLPAVKISTPARSDCRLFGSILTPWGKEKKTSDVVKLKEEDDG